MKSKMYNLGAIGGYGPINGMSRASQQMPTSGIGNNMDEEDNNRKVNYSDLIRQYMSPGKQQYKAYSSAPPNNTGISKAQRQYQQQVKELQGSVLDYKNQLANQYQDYLSPQQVKQGYRTLGDYQKIQKHYFDSLMPKPIQQQPVVQQSKPIQQPIVQPKPIIPVRNQKRDAEYLGDKFNAMPGYLSRHTAGAANVKLADIYKEKVRTGYYDPKDYPLHNNFSGPNIFGF